MGKPARAKVRFGNSTGAAGSRRRSNVRLRNTFDLAQSNIWMQMHRRGKPKLFPLGLCKRLVMLRVAAEWR
jgi:hypothetical protein